MQEREEVLQAPAHGEDHGEAAVPLQPTEGPTLGQVDVAEGVCEPAGSLPWSRFPGWTCGPMREDPGAGLLAALMTPQETHYRAACSGRMPFSGRDPFWSCL